MTERTTPAARNLHLVLAALLVAVGLAVGGSGSPASAEGVATVTVTPATGLDPAGGQVTVTGSGFDPDAHVGTRPPLAGQPSGVYVVLGRFADPWRPSEGAGSSARQVIAQRWALPAAQRAQLDPTGTNPDIILLEADGTFSTTFDVVDGEGTGTYGIATYAGSGAVDAAQETLTPLTFSTGEPDPEPEPEPDPGPEPTTPGTGTGPGGQTLTVTPATGLDPAGATITVAGDGYDQAVGVYVALCVDQGDGAAPSPCVGGADQDGSDASAWISSDPPDYAVGLATPFGAGGTFEVELTVAAADAHVDCLAEGVRCVVATRADHTDGANRSADVKVPVLFAGQEAPEPEPETTPPTATGPTGTVTAGSTVDVAGSGFLPGEQVQVWLHSTPTLLAVVTADATGAVAASVAVPADVAAGEHHVELRGVTSGRSAVTATFTVAAAASTTPTSAAGAPGAGAGAAGTPGTTGTTGTLPATGGSTGLAVVGAALVVAGGLALLARRRLVA